MKILSTNKFNEKIKLVDSETKDQVHNFIETVKNNDENIINNLSLQLLEGNVYVFRIGDYRIFFSLDSDEIKANSSVILLDLIVKGFDSNKLLSRNPKTNYSINPKFNNSINPQSNYTINPRSNSDINPQSNIIINPNFNIAINPQFNRAMNPQLNSAINPQLNSAINPQLNNSINPNINPGFNGYYLFDLTLEPIEFLIRVNEHVTIFYYFNLQQSKLAIYHSLNGYVVFDKNNKWIGHMESDNSNGFNYFDLENNWIGIVK
jgi:mRNA-degrading endonuclease RelE of RelBE toxin-antitoxin system